MGLASLRSDSTKKSERKFEKKLQFYAKVKDNVASLGAKKAIGKKTRRRQKLKAYDLSTLSEFLPELKVPQKPAAAEFKLTCKTRKELVMKEGKQLRTVLNHPAFQLNPLAAIQQHLESTQPITIEKPDKKFAKNGKKKAKKKKSKASSGPQSMDV